MASNHIFRFFFTTVVDSNCVTTRFNIKGKVTTHYGHTYNTKVSFCHLTLLLFHLFYFIIFTFEKKEFCNDCLVVQVIRMTSAISDKISCLTVKGKEIGSIWLIEVVITIAVNDIDTFKDILVSSDIAT
ncbi:Uncharacterised protein [Streptococcus pneumoniae]|nr:Uncharacterised protein [Streptococcus pneumoniae]CIV74656.1 Uncharacterised protein [Streptococcus pneumoniae]CJD68820.1 Uncharacterised protein [Streptococcus pneumoniae]